MAKSDWREKFNAWVDGEHPPRLESVLREPHVKGERLRIVLDEKAMEQELLHFLRRYHILVTLVAVVLFVVLLTAVLSMPSFGVAEKPANNVLPQEYLSHGKAETGAGNAVTAMIFSYRGFDTLGESCVLFLALACVTLLLRNAQRREAAAGEDFLSDVIFTRMSNLLVPCILLYGCYVLLGGEASPGGGFSAGSVLSAGLILYASANGTAKTQRFLNNTTVDVIRTVGLMTYLVLFAIYILAAGGSESHPLAHYFILPIDIAVGLVVMCTMYGFYAYFARGEI